MKKIFKRSVVSIVAGAVCMTSHAGFMDDFYNSAGAAANVTPGQTVQSQAGTYITGGSAVWRVPQKTFTPFQFQAPSIKAGCGGIDFFAGSFGFANSAEFVTYLRNIGQNAVGLFFQLALKSMSPQLADTIKEISDDIQRMNSYLGSSCQAAKALVNATGWPEKVAQQASQEKVANGGAGGIYDSYTQMKTSIGNSLGVTLPTAQQKNSGGAPVGSYEVNTAWLAVNSGAFAGMTQDEMSVAMTLTGTRIYRKKQGSDEIPDPLVVPRGLTVPDFAGRWNDAPTTLTVYRCPNDITSKCISDTDFSRTGTISNYQSLASKAYASLMIVRDAIINRTDIASVAGGPEAMQILGATRLPVFKILESTSTPGMIGISNMLIQKYSDLMGHEMASNYVGGITVEMEKSIVTIKQSTSTMSAGDIDDLLKSLRVLQEEAAAYKAYIDRTVGTESDLITQVQHLERSIYASFNMRLMDNLKYASRN